MFHYYLPVFFWAQEQLAAHRAGAGNPAQATPLVLGVSAPQGCGKTTLTEQLVELFAYVGLTAACVSIDDFYLTNAEQVSWRQPRGLSIAYQLPHGTLSSCMSNISVTGGVWVQQELVVYSPARCTQ